MARVKVEIDIELDDIDREDFENEEDYYGAIEKALQNIILDECDSSYEVID